MTQIESHLSALLDSWQVTLRRNDCQDGRTVVDARRYKAGELAEMETGVGGSVELAILDLVDKLERKGCNGRLTT